MSENIKVVKKTGIKKTAVAEGGEKKKAVSKKKAVANAVVANAVGPSESIIKKIANRFFFTIRKPFVAATLPNIPPSMGLKIGQYCTRLVSTVSPQDLLIHQRYPMEPMAMDRIQGCFTGLAEAGTRKVSVAKVRK